MGEPFEDIDGLFKDKLRDFSPEIPEGTWENISARLEAKSRFGVPPLVWKVAASIALILASGLTGLYLYNLKPKENLVVESLEADQQKKNEVVEVVRSHNKKIENNTEIPKVSKTLIASDRNRKNNIPPVGEKVKVITTKDTALHINDVAIKKEEPAAIKVNDNVAVVEKSSKNVIINSTTVNSEKQLAINNIIDEDFKETHKSSWMIGGHGGPQLSYRNIQREKEYISSSEFERRTEGDKMLLAYAGGIHLEYKASRKLSVKSGIYYSKMGMEKSVNKRIYETNTQDFLIPAYSTVNARRESEININNSVGTVVRVSSTIKADASSESGTLNQINSIDQDVRAVEENSKSIIIEDIDAAYQYFEVIEIPLLAKYYLFERKFNVHIQGGVSTNILVGSSVYWDNDEYAGYVDNLNKTTFSSTLGIGFGYLYKDNLRFSVDPQFKYFLTKIDNTKAASTYPYTMGIMTGVTYIF